MKKMILTPRLLLPLLLTVALLAGGCVTNFLANSGLPNAVAVAQQPATSQVTGPGADAHFILVNDYLVMEQALSDQTFVYAGLGKMLTAPTPNTNNQGKFHRDLDNSDVWSRYFTKTRIARNSELTLNREVFFLSLQDANGFYRAPESSGEARSGWWYKSRVTDVSNLQQGYLTVSGGMQVRLTALRIAVN